jgi:hypothetical protein
MTWPVLDKPGARRRKWWRRAALAALLVVALMLAAPVVFPSEAARFWLAHSGWRDVPVRFRAAQLWPTGRLTLYDVEMDDPDVPGGRRLLSAETVVADFGWTGAVRQHVQTLVLERMELAVPAVSDLPRKLEALAARGVRVDQIIATGNVRLAGEAPWMKLVPLPPNAVVPVQLVVKSADGGRGAAEDISLILGAADAMDQSFLTARFSVKHESDGTTVQVAGLNIGNLMPEVTEDLWRTWPEAPAALRGVGSGQLERLIVSGSISFGRQTTVNLTGEARNLGLQLNVRGRGAVVDHLSMTAHVEGNVSAPQLKGLKLARAHLSWDQAGTADWMLQKGTADVEVDGSEIVLSGMKSDLKEGRAEATGAFDTATGLLSRGRLWVRELPAPALRARLPEAVRGVLPDAFEGMLSARVFLVESDATHMSAYIECDCPDDLTFNIPGVAAGTGPAAATARRPTLPRAILSNGQLSGTATWNFARAPGFEVTHGRFTADELFVIPPGAPGLTEGTSLHRIKSDFGYAGGVARLEDFYADLAGNGRLYAEGNWTLPDGALEDVVVNLSGVDLGLADLWLPPGWHLTGQADVVDCRGSLSRASATIAVSLGLGSQMALRGPDWRLAATGTPTVEAGALAALDRRTGVLQIRTGDVSGLGVLQADAGLIARLRRAAGPTPGGTAAFLFERARNGAYASLDKISFSGHVDSTEAAGTVSLSGLDLGAGAARGTAIVDQDRPAVLNLSLKAEMSLGLRGGVPEAASLSVKGGQFLAERVAAGQYVLTGVAGNLGVGGGRIAITQGTLSAAEGTISGEATLSTAGQLEALHLNLKDVAQQSLYRHLYPDLFTAEGLVNGTLTLERGAGEAGDLTGAIDLTADRPGRLELSRQAAEIVAGKPAPAPSVLVQLGDYPYARGTATFRDVTNGARPRMQITLDYPRQAADAGTGPEGWQLHETVRVDSSVAEVLAEFLGLNDRPAPASTPVP